MKAFVLGFALVLATSQSACLFRASPDSFRYYTLASSAEPSVRSASGLTVGLGPVTLPGYVSRPSLVIRVDDTRVRYDDGDRWAEPLGKQFTRTLSEDLSRALGGARIIDYAWYPGAPVDVAVAVNVLAFEVDATGTATLNAGWALRDPKSHQVGYEGQSAIQEPAGRPPGEAATADAAVPALSRALARLSRELAVAIVTNTRSR
jgi:uncharacterized lipoprotein YmbA